MTRTKYLFVSEVSIRGEVAKHSSYPHWSRGPQILVTKTSWESGVTKTISSGVSGEPPGTSVDGLPPSRNKDPTPTWF